MDNHRIAPKGLNPLSTMICVKDANEAIDFYIEVFGFRSHQTMTDKQGKVVFARLLYEDINLIVMPINTIEEDDMLPPVMCRCPPHINFYVYCDDLDERYQKIQAHNLKLLHDIETKFWGDKVFKVVDPNGYIWNFASRVAEHDATKVSLEVF